MASIKHNIKQLIFSIYTILIKHWAWATTLLFITILLIAYFSIYIGSAYWTAHQFKKQLLAADAVQIQQQITPELLAPYQAKALSKQNKLHAPGQRYLKNVWPHIIQQQDLYKLLLLQADANRDSKDAVSFVDFPDTFRLSLGKDQNQLWFEWQRASWRTWQLTQLCFYNPQPLEEVNSCESSKR